MCNCLKLFGWYDWSGKPCCKMQSQWSIKDRTVTLHISSTLTNVAYYIVVKIHVIFRSAKNLKYVVQHMCIWAYAKSMPERYNTFYSRRYVGNETYFQTIVKAVQRYQETKWVVGGNAPVMAQRLVTEGSEVLLGARTSPNVIFGNHIKSKLQFWYSF